MTKVLRIMLPVLVVALAVGGLSLMIANRPAPEQREPAQAALLVDAIYPAPSEDRFRVSAQGTVRPRTETTIVAEVSGPITRLSEAFVAGGFFEAGTVLAEIDPSDYQAQLLQAEAELAQARATLAEEQARSEQSRSDWERLHGTNRRPNDLVLRLPQLAQAEAAVQAREAAVLRARRDLERTRIRLPFDGLVRQREVDLGQYVSTGSVLGTAFAVDAAEVRLPLSDRDLSFLELPRPGRAAEEPVPVRLHGTVAGEQAVWEARILRTEGVIDEDTRLYYAVAEILDPYGLLGTERPTPLAMGTFVEAEITGRSARGLMTLPRMTLREGNQVFVADDEDRLEVRRVEVVRATPERVYIRNELDLNDRVVTTAIAAPVPGLQLRVREMEGDGHQLRLLPAGEIARAGDQ